MKKQFKLYNEESNVNLLTISSLHHGIDCNKKEKIIKQVLKNTFVVYEDGHFSVYFRESDAKLAGEKIMVLIERNSRFFEKTLKLTEKFAKEADRLCRQILKVDLRKKVDNELISFLKKCYKINMKMCDIGVIAVLSDLEGFLLSNKMAEIVGKRSHDEKRDYLTVLGMPIKLSPVQKMKFKLQNIRAKKRLKSEIRKVLEKCLWIDYGYQGPLVEEEDMYKFFVERKSNILDPKKIKILQKKYKKKLKLTKDESAYFENAQDFGYQKALWVDVRNSMCYCMDSILKEVSRRTFYALNQLRYALPDEIKEVLKKQGLKRYELDERRKFSVVYFNRNGAPKVLVGDKAKKYIKMRIKPERINRRLKKFKGMTAQPGEARGKVKIVNCANDMKKMNEGDILVAYATTPEVVPAMGKASAIVTEAGGITCHAAIVSRETGIPCVVGIKYAVKILKDGDKVEVDATRGVVRKI